MHPLRIAAAVLALAAVHPVHAQEPAEAPLPVPARQADDGLTGTRVRVTAPHFAPHRVVGTVTAYTDQRLVVAEDSTGEVFEFPLRGVQRLDPFMGGSAGSTAWYRGRLGAFLGGAVGLVAGAAIGSAGGGDAVKTMLVGGGVGVGVGATVGALYGAASPRERWGWVMGPWGYDPGLRPGGP